MTEEEYQDQQELSILLAASNLVALNTGSLPTYQVVGLCDKLITSNNAHLVARGISDTQVAYALYQELQVVLEDLLITLD